ncbi:WD40 repeat domain-containing protein, partial [Crocosphaera sp. Alani8]|uniref:WD40 repeat domain-containing protein n=1 Tax=Crocosphaera sp. Alani8 TaxID=3038952 RepID=UPI00406CAAD1
MTERQIRFYQISIRSEQRRKFLNVVGIGILVGLTGLTSLLAINFRRAEQEALARQLALKSEWLGSQRADLYTTSALLAVKASKAFTKDKNPLEVDQALRNGLRLLANLKQQFEHEEILLSVVFSPDGEKVATASLDNTARVWQVGIGEELARLHHEDTVWSVVFSPDGEKVATASLDNTARVWQVGIGEELARLHHEDTVWSVVFSPDGEKVATASGDGTARVW